MHVSNDIYLRFISFYVLLKRQNNLGFLVGFTFFHLILIDINDNFSL